MCTELTMSMAPLKILIMSVENAPCSQIGVTPPPPPRVASFKLSHLGLHLKDNRRRGRSQSRSRRKSPSPWQIQRSPAGGWTANVDLLRQDAESRQI